MTRALPLLFAVLSIVVSQARGQASPSSAMDSVSLRSGDLLRVAIWREAGLNGEFQVDANGDLSLPMLGTRHVSGVPWVALRDSLVRGYEHELKTPSIVLTPLRRVLVLGAVTRPGVYFLDPTFNLEGTISLAGGASTEGNLERIRILRDGITLQRTLSVKKPVVDGELRSGDQIFVERRSWVDRNSAFLLTSVLSVAGIVVALVKK
jgi:polysaccharide export outer membrane protein